MKKIPAIVLSLILMALVPTALFSTDCSAALSGRIVVEGSEDNQELMRALAGAFERLNPGTEVVVPEGIGSSGGIRRAREGKTDLARITRPLDQNEMKYGLTYAVFARSPVVFFLNGAAGVESLTYEQIVGIYSGRLDDWQSLGGHPGKIYFIGREAGDSGRRAFSRFIPGLRDFAAGGKTYYSSTEAVNAVKSHKNTIGYGLMATVKKSGAKVLRINGVAPSPDNLRNGRYELSTPLGIVYRKETLSSLAAAFVEFLYSAEGRRIITEYGCLPVNR